MHRALAAALIAAALAAPLALSEPGSPRAGRSEPQRIADLRGAVWRCEDELGRARTRASQGAWALPAGPYRRWVLKRWRARATACAAERARRVLPHVRDWQTAVRLVQRVYPGSEGWLLACSSSEGGHGAWVPNRQGSGAGGWMQYMAGTYEHDYNRASEEARRRGYVVPAAAASWYSALGQALAGGWAYHYSRPSGKWTGSRC